MRINYPQVLRQAGQIEDLGGELKGVANKINAMMLEIQGTWKGDASLEYLKVCEELRQNMEKTSKSINSVASLIRKVARRIHEEDERRARAARHTLRS
jgi:WXG100 family type VII secretion target